ncbi:putative glucosylceramidase 4 [Cylas formicarius]|uniref:putative glucosylceramidase 4 n=1 Tax=Cylas formicarius TaxID=197179 RepID=UPI002958519D|nr:putative glucosylceramidase 4 [Cylas formicarius]
MLNLICFLLMVNLIRAELPCVQREVEYGTVCVCNSSYCDTVPEVVNLTSRQYQIYSTSKGNLGFHSNVGQFSNEIANTLFTVSIPDLNAKRQTILGFGGAFTGTAGYNILTLPEDAQDKLLESYFGESGIQYTVCRTQMGASDYSVTGFTNLDNEDETLDTWSLQVEDTDYKIPIIKKAQKLRGEDLKLFLSSWSSPKWMKTVDDYLGSGELKAEYFDLWARYYMKFFEAYRSEGVEFWGVTPQNEPFTSPTTNINLRFSYDSMNNWITNNFGPAIRNSSFKDLKILFFDDDTYLLTAFKSATLNNKAIDYADGISIHWYTDGSNQDEWLVFPDNLFVLATEACQGIENYMHQKNVQLGNWDRGVGYINSIIYDLEHNYVGWVEWNLALNADGGPSWLNASLDAPIIINADAGEFYKQAMFYVIGHFSKFVVPGSQRIDITSENLSLANIKAAAFERPDGNVVLILHNGSGNKVFVQVSVGDSTEPFELEADSINSILYAV